jgi:hypothetical protein
LTPRQVQSIYETSRWGTGHMTFTTCHDDGSVSIRLRPMINRGIATAQPLLGRIVISGKELSWLTRESLAAKVDLEFSQALVIGEVLGERV